MIFFIKINFVILLILYIHIFKKLINNRIGFSLGIVFGVLYFIFIPLSVLFFTGIVEISKIDFYATNLRDIILEDNISNSILLISYLYTIYLSIFLTEFYLPKKKKFKKIIKKKFPLAWKKYLLISLGISISIFFLAGIQNGGNWYVSRDSFFKESGFIGLILIDSFVAFKLLFIASILLAYKKYKISKVLFFIVIFIFSLLDIVLTGNRIYVFILFSMLLIYLIKTYKKKVIFLLILIIPFGYMMSIYRHIRGQLFIEGIPSFSKTMEIISNTIQHDPPDISGFLLGISESVNLNVIYETFDYITLKTTIWGETFLKAFVFFIPRSMWHDKPISITQIAGHYYAPQAEHLSLVTTLIGETHTNFYIFGIFILPIILIITNKFLSYLFKGGEFESILLFLIGLLIFRMPYSDILLVSFFVFFYYKFILITRRIKVK